MKVIVTREDHLKAKKLLATMSVKEVSRFMGLSLTTIYRIARSRNYKHYKEIVEGDTTLASITVPFQPVGEKPSKRNWKFWQ